MGSQSGEMQAESVAVGILPVAIMTSGNRYLGQLHRWHTGTPHDTTVLIPCQAVCLTHQQRMRTCIQQYHQLAILLIATGYDIVETSPMPCSLLLSSSVGIRALCCMLALCCCCMRRMAYQICLCIAESPCSGQYAKAYSVRQGDILNTIASACNVTLPQLEAANTQITEFDMIQPGNTVCVPPACSKALRIPLSQDTTPPPCSGQFAGSYAIRTGDSLNDIATACRVTLADLEAANTQLTDFDTIQPGTPVCVLPSCTAFLQSAPTAAAAQQSPTAASPLATFTAPPSSPLPPVGSPPPAVVAEGGPSPA